GLAGCDIPTELPRFETVWETVLLRDSVSTAELLPEDVRLHPDGGFVVDSFTASEEVRLEDVCEFCTCFEGPIPALDIAPWDWRFQLPSRLLEAEVTEGTARVVLHNEAGFDVLDDGEGGRGFIEIAFVDTRTESTLDSARIAGPFPDGDSVTVDFDLAGLRLGSSLVARVSGRTPGTGCDSVDLTVESGFRTDVRLLDVRAPSVLVVLADADLDVAGREVDLPEAVADRLRPGEARVWLEVRADTRLPVATELELSVASRPDRLFTGEAALFTPLVLPEGVDRVARIRKTYLVDVGRLQGATTVYLDARNRILGDRVVTLDGIESVAYSLTLHAELPTR
ncbi:MAG TPA: hypothetical protein VLL48_06925, partial [Longimicrobiales bacterium]|nr:hypothetical protein [Longimicrobiales bacterium]